MYADDTNLTTCSTSQKSLFDKVNKDISNVQNWLKANKLSLNSTKTEYMLIGSDDNLRKIHPEQHLFLNDKPIKRVTEAKTLGVVIDERMSWTAHIDEICKKVSSGLSGIRQIRDYVPLETVITIYDALIQPWFDYCDVVWDNLPKTLADKLQRMQNRAARIITKSSYERRSNDILVELGWTNLKQRRINHKATIMYKILNNLAPMHLGEPFLLQDNSYHLREREKSLKLPKPRTSSLKRALSYDGAKVWNALPQNVRLSKSLKKFKNNLSSIGSLTQ